MLDHRLQAASGTLHPVPDADRPHDHTLQVVATASSGAESDLICQRLAEAGIVATSQRSIGGPQWGLSGSQYVYVEPGDVDRAREILGAPDGLTEDELARLSQEATSRRLEGTDSEADPDAH
jgi:hypothetical protein